MKKFVSPHGDTLRRNVVLSLLGLFAFAVLARVVYLQVYQADFLVKQGNSRFIRTKQEPALRGTITDRNNIPLAVSTPVTTLWVNPKELLQSPSAIAELATALGLSQINLQKKLDNKKQSSFMYVKRAMEPEIAKNILKKQLPGVYSLREYRRFYPSGEVTAQIVGYNNIDDKGQEGLELQYNTWLSGTPGSSEIIRDIRGKVVDVLEEIQPPLQGKTLQLSIDKRLQYLTYMALLETTEKFNPKSATAVMLDAKTSEVLAMVSVPSGNPNNLRERHQSLIRNRAMVDVFEPGSVMKPFAVAAALDAGLVKPHTLINTKPGYLTLNNHTVTDTHNNGVLSVSDIIKKSSNIGTCKIALRLPKAQLHALYESLGFGLKSAITFPAEQRGTLRKFATISDFDYCTNAYGYGLSMTALQLAQAYAVIANDGVKIPASLLKRSQATPGTRLFSRNTAAQVRRMLQAAVSQDGTGKLATKGDYMQDYSVGGKTGTVHKVVGKRYAKDKYRSVFAGMAPMSDPRIVMAIVIDEPQGKKYYGGLVAAPVFAKVVGKSLRLLGVAPDQVPQHENPVIHTNQTR